MLFGITGVLFGVALALSATYPTWLGLIGIIGGAGTIVGGLLTAFLGFSPTAMNVGMPFNLIIIVWIALAGIFMWRRAIRQ